MGGPVLVRRLHCPFDGPGLWIGSDERLHRHESEFRFFGVVIMECLKKELLLNFLPWSKTPSFVFFKKRAIE